MQIIVIKGRERLVLEIPDRHTEKFVMLPTGHEIEIGMIGTVWLIPSGRPEGAPITQPDPVRTDDAHTLTRHKGDEPDMFGEAA